MSVENTDVYNSDFNNFITSVKSYNSEPYVFKIDVDFSDEIPFISRFRKIRKGVIIDIYKTDESILNIVIETDLGKERIKLESSSEESSENMAYRFYKWYNISSSKSDNAIGKSIFLVKEENKWTLYLPEDTTKNHRRIHKLDLMSRYFGYHSLYNYPSYYGMASPFIAWAFPTIVSLYIISIFTSLTILTSFIVGLFLILVFNFTSSVISALFIN